MLDASVNREGLPSAPAVFLPSPLPYPNGRTPVGALPVNLILPVLAVVLSIYGVRSWPLLDFLGEIATAFWILLSGKTRFRRSEFLLIIQECSAGALPIVSLISFLVGLILAYVGAIQLRMFGAQIYVADLVGVGMVRAMGAI